MPTTAPGRRARQPLTPEQRAARLLEARERLAEGVDALMSSDGWRQLIESRRWLRKYSLNNQIMILQQCPEATDVRPLSAWNAAGYRMRKGTKQIRIWAPGSRRAATTQAADETAPAVAEPTAERNWAPVVPPRFILVNVVDVSQLETPPDQPVGPTELRGAAPTGMWDELVSLLNARGFGVERGPCDGAFGTTNFTTRTVRVREDVEPAQAAKTLCHEYAHILCDHEQRTDAPRPLREVEAESVACIVTSTLGLDTLSYSVPYVARWAGDREVARASAERVLTVADHILTSLGAPPPTTSPSSAA